MGLGLAIKALMAGGTALGGAYSGYGLSQLPQQHRNELVRQGPDEVSGEYAINPLLRPFIDVDSLDDSRDIYVTKQTKKDPRVLDALGLVPDLQVAPGQTADEFLRTNRSKIRDARTKEKITDYNTLQGVMYNNPFQREERERRDRLDQERNDIRRDEMRNNERNRQTTLQLGQINARTAQGNQALQRELGMMQNNTTLQLAQMDSDLADKRLAYDRETRRMDRRDRNIAQLMQGLGQLGGAFAL